MEKLTTIFSPSLNASLPNLLSDVNEHILDLLSSSMWALSVKIPFETECCPGSRKKQFHRLYISTGLNSSPLHQKKKCNLLLLGTSEYKLLSKHSLQIN